MAWTVRWLCEKNHIVCATSFEDFLHDHAHEHLLDEIDMIVETNVCYCGASFSERKIDYYDGSLEAAHEDVQKEYKEPTIVWKTEF